MGSMHRTLTTKRKARKRKNPKETHTPPTWKDPSYQCNLENDVYHLSYTHVLTFIDNKTFFFFLLYMRPLEMSIQARWVRG